MDMYFYIIAALNSPVKNIKTRKNNLCNGVTTKLHRSHFKTAGVKRLRESDVVSSKSKPLNQQNIESTKSKISTETQC